MTVKKIKNMYQNQHTEFRNFTSEFTSAILKIKTFMMKSTKIQRCERRLDCRYAIDIHDFVLNIPSLAAKAEAERRRLKRKELLSSSSDAKRQRNEKVGVHSDRKDNRRSKSSNRDGGSSRDEDLKNTGDLSKEAIRAGWRMKLSARHEGKPYYYRLK